MWGFSELQDFSWSLFETFVMKDIHKMNKMTLGIFASDKLKSTVLSMMIGIPVYFAFMRLTEWGGD
jgi:STE24 endopeptidase